jgi:hypothetical protein
MNARDARTILKRSILYLMWLLPAGLGSILAQLMRLRDVDGSTENHTTESKELDGNSNPPSPGASPLWNAKNHRGRE